MDYTLLFFSIAFFILFLLVCFWALALRRKVISLRITLNNCGIVLAQMTKELVSDGKDVKFTIDEYNAFCRIGEKEENSERFNQ